MQINPDRASSALDHERLTSLINSMADGVIAVDQHVRIVLYNAAALNILDLNGSLEGKQLGKVFRPIDANNDLVDIEKLVSATVLPTTNRDLKLKYADNSDINLYMSVAPVRLGYGKREERSFVLLLRDITREKSLEEERDEFISVVSHELRTPVAIAEGNVSNAQFIAGSTQNLEKVKQALKEAHVQILFLSALINDLSTLSRAERGKLTVEIEPINIQSFLTELASNYTPDAKAKGLSIKTEFDSHLETFYSSKLYVREILQNFITNALKYTQAGSVTIGAKPADGGVEFWVHDTGIGISHSDQTKVFDKFFRSEDFRTRESSGTGLGLYVTAKLAKLLHAHIRLESELNHGSTFQIFIPSLEKP